MSALESLADKMHEVTGLEDAELEKAVFMAAAMLQALQNNDDTFDYFAERYEMSDNK